MAPSQRRALALIGLVASARAIPAAIPQISLYPPGYSVSWDTPAPEPTEDPEESSYSIPAPSDQISLYPPSYSVSWYTGAEPTTAPEEPDSPEPAPTPSDQISLTPPSYSVSWDVPIPTSTKKPWPPHHSHSPPPGRPTRHSITWETGRPHNTEGVSWETGHADNTGGASWDVSEPSGETTLPILNPPAPSDQITIVPPSYSVSWGKRQEDEPEPTEGPAPEPTEEPEPAPEDPNDGSPVDIPPFIPPSPPDSIGIQPPQASVSWGKRQDQGDPTDAPTDAPTDIPPIQTPPPDQISNLPPDESVSWGKREAAPETNSYGFESTHLIPSYTTPKSPQPTGSVGWNKRQDEEDPTDEPEPIENPDDEFPIPPVPVPSDDIDLQPPTATVIWGRDAEPEPQSNSWGFQFPSYTVAWPKPPKSSAQVSWGKRQEDEPEPTYDPGDELPAPAQPTPSDEIGIEPPQATVIWGKKQEDEPEPTDDSGDELPAPSQPTPSDEIGIEPPQATVIWGKGKREPEAEHQSNSWGFQFPSFTVHWPKPPKTSAQVSWGKRDAAPQTNDVSFAPPQATLSWGKREPDAAPQGDQISAAPPQATVIWGKDKREAEAEAEAKPQSNSWGFQFPSFTVHWPKPPKSSANVSWGKRDAAPFPEPTALAALVDREASAPSCAETTIVTKPVPCPMLVCADVCPVPAPPASGPVWQLAERTEPEQAQEEECPVTLTATRKCPSCACTPTPIPLPTLTTSYKPQPSGLCPTVTATIALPCIPPSCPNAADTPCDLEKPIPRMERKVRREGKGDVIQVEKRIVTIKTVTPSFSATPTVDKCTAAETKTVYGTCPTFTCVPWCDPTQVVR